MIDKYDETGYTGYFNRINGLYNSTNHNRNTDMDYIGFIGL